MWRQKEEQMQAVALACAVLLMLGCYMFTTMQMQMKNLAADSNLTEPVVPVLMYHHILPQADITGLFADNNVVVSLEQFQQDIHMLKSRGYETVSLRQLNDFVRNGTALPPKSIVITFDDGYLSNKQYAMPVLQEAGYTAVIFSLTGWMEEHPQTFNTAGLQYLSWPEIRQMGNVFQFASHTDNLHSLSWNGSGKLTTVSRQELADDLRRSIQKLQGTSYFSYPYGHYNAAARQVLIEQGIDLAFTVTPVSVRAGDDPLTLGRWDMYQYRLEDVLPPV